MSPYCLIFGFGYTAKILAPKLLSKDFHVIGTKRLLDSEKTEGIQCIDFNCLNMKNHIAQSTHLLIAIPPTHTRHDLVLIKYGELIKKQASHLQWVGYLSSTGVYGDHQGKWVDENTTCTPHTPTGIARLKEEQAWFSYAKTHQLPLHVFRLSGIYGPGRNALHRLQHGKKHSIFKEDQVFCRIHVEDIASTLLASIESPKPLSIYNVSDDEPAPAHVVDNYAASLLHREPLPLIPVSGAHLSPMEQDFYANNRRVCNLKIKKELNITLKYPTYREGLTQIWQNNFAPA